MDQGKKPDVDGGGGGGMAEMLSGLSPDDLQRMCPGVSLDDLQTVCRANQVLEGDDDPTAANVMEATAAMERILRAFGSGFGPDSSDAVRTLAEACLVGADEVADIHSTAQKLDKS